MTAAALISAVLVGVTAGALARALRPARRTAGVLVTVPVGVGAALTATVLARMLGVDTPGVHSVEIAAQSGPGHLLCDRRRRRPAASRCRDEPVTLPVPTSGREPSRARPGGPGRDRPGS
jgi:uncharacterized membrane protein YeaQ/YmgE (transglycosylase-associated protein family)